MPAPAKRYRAFISYSRKDEIWARRIHAALEAYRAPRGVNAHVDHKTRRLGRIFRDDDEMSACHSLGASIENALADAETLIVICSPHAARSAWVDMEVRRYRTNPNARVLAVIVDGRPNAENPAEECFCPGLRWRVAPDGRLTDVLDEPLAPDVRRESLDRIVARLAAGMLGVKFDHLWRRQARRTGRRRTIMASLVASCALIAIGAHTQVEHAAQTAVATSTLDIAAQRLETARSLSDVTDLDAVLRLALIAATDSGTPNAARDTARDLITETIAATRTQWRFDTLGGAPAALAFSPDGTNLIAISTSGRATVLNMETGREVTRVELGGTPISVSPHGAHILVATPIGAQLWRTDNWSAIPLSGETPTCAEFHPDTASLVTCAADGGARLWRLQTGGLIQRIANDGPAWTAAAFDATGERILLSAGFGSWSIWGVETGETVATLPHSGRNLDWATPGIYNYFVAGLAAAPYGAVLTPTGAAPLSGHDAPVIAARLYGEGPARIHVASADTGGRLIVSGVAHPMTRPTFNERGHSDPITALAVSPDQKFAATGDAEGHVRVWSLTPLASDLTASIAANTDPVSMACDEDAHHLPSAARKLTEKDVAGLPQLAPLIGQDVCKITRG